MNSGRPATLSSWTSRFAHAAVAALVLLAYAAVFGRKLLERGSPERLLAFQLHYTAGILVLLIGLPWLLSKLRVRVRRQASLSTKPPLQRAAARTVHAVLFLFLVVQPSLGLLSKMARGRGIDMPCALGTIPSLVGRHPAWANTAEDLHVMLGTGVCALVGMHVAAAGWHWYAARYRGARAG